VAAILVVVHHYSAPFKYLQKLGMAEMPVILTWGKMGMFGAVGVPIFFVISGFVMGLQPESSGWRGIWRFSAKRLLRIVPLYWFLTIVAALTIGPALVVGPSLTWHVIQSLTFTSGGVPVILPGWTLEFEMMFYLAFAMIVASGAAESSNRGIAVLICVFVVLAAANLFGLTFAAVGNPIILEFCAGLIISRIYKQADIAALWPLYLIVAAMLFLLSVAPSQHRMGMIELLWGGGAFFLVLGLVCAELQGFVIGKGRIWSLLGDSSYAIYLFHMPFSTMSFGLLFWSWPVLQTWVYPGLSLAYLVACGVLAGVIVHLVIERPMMRTSKWLLKRQDPDRSGPPGELVQGVNGGADGSTGHFRPSDTTISPS